MRGRLLFLCLLLSACNSPQRVQSPRRPTVPPAQVETALAQLIAWRTQTAEANPTATFTHTPFATPTLTPSPTLPLTEEAALTEAKGDGVYLVGVEIALGRWRSEQLESGLCYWARYKNDGVILESYYGPPGVTMHIRPGDYEVEMIGCGTWTYVGT